MARWNGIVGKDCTKVDLGVEDGLKILSKRLQRLDQLAPRSAGNVDGASPTPALELVVDSTLWFIGYYSS